MEVEHHVGSSKRTDVGGLSTILTPFLLKEHGAIGGRTIIDRQVIIFRLRHDITCQLNKITLWCFQHKITVTVIAVVAGLVAFLR